MEPSNINSVLVTGGGSGIGAGTAKYLAKKGSLVTICGRSEEKLIKVSEEIGESCHYVVANITQQNDREILISEAVKFGNGLNALINCAGNMYRVPLEKMEENSLEDIFKTNVISGMMLAKESLEHLKLTQGSIVFISSVHTKRSFSGASPYAATKGAIETLTQVLASELGEHGIRVNCVSPGAVLSEINIRAGLFSKEENEDRMNKLAPEHVLGRIGTSTEIAEAIAYLIEAKWTTGAILRIDGGLSLGKIKD
jgi:3-oxoacyl-[acyl-carrier protein] reductase|tara:strand:- start:2259 stop:3020 length:762 start_codon:yes stop_codon:yes gene_type:complete